MLGSSRKLLLLNEFFGVLDRNAIFTTEPVSGERFGHMLLEDSPEIGLFRSRYNLLVKAKARVVAGSLSETLRGERPLPLLCMLLASPAHRMQVDPVYLAMRTTRLLKTAPVRRVNKHYQAIFDWLAQQSAAEDGWCERSGGSLEIFGQLVEAFPNARFLHLHRDGLATALSMHAHPIFALRISFANHPMSPEESKRANAPPVEGDEGEVDPIVRRLTTDAPTIEECGRYWSSVVVNGMRAAASLGKSEYLDVRYEDLTLEPQRTLEKIAAFFGWEADEAWLREAAGFVDNRAPIKRVPSLDEPDLAALEVACADGQQCLGRA